MTDEITFLPEGSNSPTQIVFQGRFVHSRKPQSEAKRQAAELLNRKPKVVLLMGAGLGFLLEELLLENVLVIWLEEIPQIQKAALLRLSSLFDKLKLKATKPTATTTEYRNQFNQIKLIQLSQTLSLANLEKITNGNLTSLQSFILRTTARPSYTELLSQIDQKQFKEIVNQNTLQRFDRLWLKNIYYNLYYYQQFKPLNHLIENQSPKPAVVVSAGPSLNQSLGLLKKFRDKFVLIAVDTAIHVLNKFQIDADYLLTVDAQLANFLHLRSYTGNAKLIIDLTVSYLTMRHIRGFYYLFANPLPAANFFLKRLFDDQLSVLQFGGSVSTNAFDFALKLGSPKIYLCGLDLSFVNHQTHSKGSALEETALSKTNRLLSPQLQNYRQITAIDRRYLKNKNSKLVPTNDKLLIFYHWYLSQFEKLKESHNSTQLYIVDGQGAYFPQVNTVSVSEFEQHLMTAPQITTPLDQTQHPALPKQSEATNSPYTVDFIQTLKLLQEQLDSILLKLKDPPSINLAKQLLDDDAASGLQLLKLLSTGMQTHLNLNFENLTKNQLAEFFAALTTNCKQHQKLLNRLIAFAHFGKSHSDNPNSL